MYRLISTIFSVTSLFSVCFCATLSRTGCMVSINEHLTSPQPLLLLQNEAELPLEAFPLPVDEEGTLVFATGETIDLACPGGTVIIDNFNTGKVFVEAKCLQRIIFLVEGSSVAFPSITCSIIPQRIARYNGNECSTKHKEIEIGFDINGRFITHVTTCFDAVLQHVLYSTAVITSAIAGYQSGYPRPSFIGAEFFNVRPDTMNSLYTRDTQRKTINGLLGLEESNSSIIHPTNDFFLSKGHYAAKADFVYGSQQRLTFYYINVAPQWQTCNGGNWNLMEMNCRNLANDRQVDLVTYTGSYGITTLPHVNGNEQELFLWVSEGAKRGIPVPAFFYRAIYEPISKAGVVLITINNPYKKNITNDIVCMDVCNKISWLTWKPRDAKLGYSYCCEVDDFRKTVNTLPYFEVTSLLV